MLRDAAPVQARGLAAGIAAQRRAGGQRLPQRQRAAPRRPGTWRQTFRGCWRGSGIRRGARRERRGIPAEPTAGSPPGSVDKAGRNRRDAAAAMGRAARDVGGRVAASLGLLAERLPSFEATATVANGGVLTAVPALLRAGLLQHAGLLRIPPGFYGLRSVLCCSAGLHVPGARAQRRAPALRAARRMGRPAGPGPLPRGAHLAAQLDQLAADPEALHAWRAALAGQWPRTIPQPRPRCSSMAMSRSTAARPTCPSTSSRARN